MKYVYHFKRPSMRGEKLYPLNRLKEIYPETFDNHASKYKGREVLMERQLPLLNCLWNDVLHLSPIHPQIILDTWEEHGLKLEPREFPVYKIPLDQLSEEKLIYFDPHVGQYGNFEFTDEQVRPFNLDEYQEQEQVSHQQIEIWKKDRTEGRQMFWFSHTTHVLYQGEIDVSAVEIIKCC